MTVIDTMMQKLHRSAMTQNMRTNPLYSPSETRHTGTIFRSMW
jgi:hypothetical protein